MEWGRWSGGGGRADGAVGGGRWYGRGARGAAGEGADSALLGGGAGCVRGAYTARGRDAGNRPALSRDRPAALKAAARPPTSVPPASPPRLTRSTKPSARSTSMAMARRWWDWRSKICRARGAGRGGGVGAACQMWSNSVKRQTPAWKRPFLGGWQPLARARRQSAWNRPQAAAMSAPAARRRGAAAEAPLTAAPAAAAPAPWPAPPQIGQPWQCRPPAGQPALGCPPSCPPAAGQRGAERGGEGR
jgi:hypothetical protein